MKRPHARLALLLFLPAACSHYDLPPQVGMVEPAYQRISEWESRFDAELYDHSSEFNRLMTMDAMNEEQSKLRDGLWLLANNTDKLQARARLANLTSSRNQRNPLSLLDLLQICSQ